MKPCLSEATTMPASFVEDVEACAAAGWVALEVWLTKLETALERHTAEELKRIVADKGVTLAAASYQGGLLLGQGEARREHYEHFKRRLDLCQQFGIRTLLVAADAVAKVSATELQRSVVSLAQAAQWAAGFGVTLALEFRGGDAFPACLDTALSLVEACGESNVGVNLDVFHWCKGNSKNEDLARLTANNLAFVQLCDVAGVPRELMTDSDRVLPGDGDFYLRPILEHLRKIGYTGFVSVEVLNPMLWQAKPSLVGEMALAALNRVIRG